MKYIILFIILHLKEVTFVSKNPISYELYYNIKIEKSPNFQSSIFTKKRLVYNARISICSIYLQSFTIIRISELNVIFACQSERSDKAAIGIWIRVWNQKSFSEDVCRLIFAVLYKRRARTIKSTMIASESFFYPRGIRDIAAANPREH